MPATSTRTVPSANSSASSAPLCFIIDEEARVRHFLSLILQGSGVDAMDFADGASFRGKRPPRPANIVFLNIGVNSNDAIATLETLGKSRYPGAVQLMSSQGEVALENLKRIGEHQKLRMLPVLKKPFETATIKKILESEKLGDRTGMAGNVRLDEALKNGWIETWYQPKINLRKKQLVGAEAFARVRHPELGVMQPSAFMKDAEAHTLRALAEHTLTKVLKCGLEFSQIGINLRIAINMSLDSLVELPVSQIVNGFRPNASGWPGLIVDVTEEQVVNNIERTAETAKQLQSVNVKLAIDDFGRGVSSLIKVKDIPFAEMKLDRVFVTDCAADEVNASICKTVIDMAHSFGSLAVGIGLEKAADVTALVNMGCDVGQGYLLGQPMAEERFVALLKQRAASQASTPKLPAPTR